MNEGPVFRVLLVDGTGMLVRAARAGHSLGLSSNGEDTGPLMMFAGMLCKQLRTWKPSHVAICWDGPGAGKWRKQLCPGYKAQRPPRGEAPGPEEHLAGKFCAAARLAQPHIGPGYEADDLIAMCWDAFRGQPGGWTGQDIPEMREFARIVIASDDADLRQLLANGVIQVPLSASNGDSQPWDLKRVQEHYGCEPEQLPRLRAIAGDRSDGIPGVPGVGAKKAVKMLAQGGASAIADHDLRIQVQKWATIMDLRYGLSLMQQQHPSLFDGNYAARLTEAMAWDRAAALKPLASFLDHYELARLSGQLADGRLL